MEDTAPRHRFIQTTLSGSEIWFENLQPEVWSWDFFSFHRSDAGCVGVRRSPSTGA